MNANTNTNLRTNNNNNKEITMHSPYQAAKLINAVLAEANLPSIPPQMMYNYTTARLNKGKAPLIKCDASGAITLESLLEWLAKYLEKKGIQVAPQTEEDYAI